jgi:hypothetical protein
MSKALLRIISRAQQITDIPLDKATTLVAEKGATYQLIDPATQKAVKGMVLKKQGDALVIEVDNEAVAQIDQFYAEGQEATFDVSGANGATGQAQTVTASTPAAEGSNVVWQASAGDSAAVAAGAESSLFGPALGGVGAVGALAAGGGGAAAAAAAVNSVVSGFIVAGPVQAGNDLTVDVFQADGVTLIGTATVDATGAFSINVGSYVGVVIAKLNNGGANPDYMDEATNAPKDLNAQLFAVGEVTAPNSVITLNLNPLTTVAYQTAVNNAPGGVIDAATVTAANTAVATAFGVADLHATTVVTVLDAGYNAGDGMTASETYGAVLASFSGADLNNGGNSQTTIDNVVAGITLTGNTATLNTAAQQEVITGGTAAGVNATYIVTQLLDTTAPAAPTAVLATDSGTSNSDGVTNVGTMDVTGVEAGATWQYSLDASQTWSAAQADTVTSFTLAAGTYATGDILMRQADVASNVTVIPSSNAAAITVDTTAPTLTVSAVDISADSGTSATDFNTNTAAQTITGTLSGTLAAGDILYGSVDNGTSWTDITNKVTGTAISWDSATLSGSSNILFTVTDAAGNDSATTGGTAYALDTAAPILTVGTVDISAFPARLAAARAPSEGNPAIARANGSPSRPVVPARSARTVVEPAASRTASPARHHPSVRAELAHRFI